MELYDQNGNWVLQVAITDSQAQALKNTTAIPWLKENGFVSLSEILQNMKNLVD